MHSQTTPGRQGEEPLSDEALEAMRGPHIHHGPATSVQQDDSIAAQVNEHNNAERYSTVDDVLESRQRFSATNINIPFQQRHQQQFSSVSVSEGVASAGHPPVASLDRMGEFVPGEVGLTGMYEGEATGMYDPVGAWHGYVDADTNTPTATHGPRPGGQQEQQDDGCGAASPMDVQDFRKSRDGSVFGACSDLEGNESTGQQMDGVGAQQVSSEMAMVTGLSDGENEQPSLAGHRRNTTEPTDSNIGCIGLGNAGGEGEIQASASFKDRPSDADIIAWENQIREGEANKSPLIGNKCSIDTLWDEYAAGNEVFKAKITTLASTYGSIRRSRGDGNCFFRSFIFSYLEHLVQTKDEEEKNRMTSTLTSLRTLLVKAGYEELVLEGPMELLLGMLSSIQDSSNPLSIETLENNMRSEEISNYIVFLLRIITSAEVKDKANFFAPFIMGLTDMAVDEFCSKCIDPMGEESEHVQVVALTNALRVPIRVVYLDRSTMAASGASNTCDSSDSPLSADTHDFIPEGCSVSADDIRVHLLYRPGHYDILYKKNF
eukprot:jgi/Picre1/28323/NNA_003729.t1